MRNEVIPFQRYWVNTTSETNIEQPCLQSSPISLNLKHLIECLKTENSMIKYHSLLALVDVMKRPLSRDYKETVLRYHNSIIEILKSQVSEASQAIVLC